jgi:ABC-type transporter Mla MlaB component
VLRITTDMTERAVTLTLEGRLTGIWVPELERCWQTVRTTRPGHPICIDMRGLIFVDAAGKQLLANMYGCGADLMASGCLMKGVVEEIYTDGVRLPMASGTRQPRGKREK